MRDPNNKDKNKNSDLEEEIRRGRKFSLTEAVGREAGKVMKGASPVPPARQLLMQIEEILARELVDSDGSLIRTIVAQLKGNLPLLGRHFGDAVGALLEYLDGVLKSDANLADLVREADARWGRDYDERPRFERPGQAPQPDDPYTIAEVTASLTALRAGLTP